MTQYGGPLWDSLLAMDHVELARRYFDLVLKESDLEHTVAMYRQAVSSAKLPKRAAKILADAAEIVSIVEDAILDAGKA